MRLICPNCDAQYEVDDSAIPEGGRDVQCSNCGHAWFQEAAAEPVDASDVLYTAPDEAEEPPPPPAVDQHDDETENDYDEDYDEGPAPAAGEAPVQRSLDESILAVLREEAEREAATRKSDAARIEMQGDLGLPPPVSPAVGAVAAASAAVVADAALTETEKRISAMKGESVTPVRPAARRDLLPDIEEINSTLSPSDAPLPDPDLLPDLTRSGRSGFRSGFALMILIAVVGAVLYIMAPQISQQIPGAADTMSAYVAAVDAGRIWLDGMIRKATVLLNGLTGADA